MYLAEFNFDDVGAFAVFLLAMASHGLRLLDRAYLKPRDVAGLSQRRDRRRFEGHVVDLSRVGPVPRYHVILVVIVRMVKNGVVDLFKIQP